MTENEGRKKEENLDRLLFFKVLERRMECVNVDFIFLGLLAVSDSVQVACLLRAK